MNWGLILDRSRSKLNPIQQIQKDVRANNRAIERLTSKDRAIDWKNATLLGTWVSFGAGEDPASYSRTASGLIICRGVVKFGTVPSSIFVFPVGFRPGNARRFAVVSNAAFGYVMIISDGTLSLQVGNNAYVDLSGICFRAEQ